MIDFAWFVFTKMKNKYLIIGGAGFIGSNLADRLLSQKQEVVIFDNLSRTGSEKNLAWLTSKYQNKFEFIRGDIVRDIDLLADVVKRSNSIFHFAAQVAVTTSVLSPRNDFEVNALGTFNVLESIRKFNPEAKLLYTSTNKVYGSMENVEVVESESSYEYKLLKGGISEDQPLDFHSPYGCSKGAGDQYVRDYSRIYGLKTVVFRQSCIYGPRQFGVEDQGWIAWFIIALLTKKDITIYGDGKQVRDVLYIDDLLDAFQLAFDKISTVKGMIFNIGGGPKNTISVWYQFRPILEQLLGKKIMIKHDDWRPGDQKIYISDISKANKHLCWVPKHTPEKGIGSLFKWVKDNINLFT